MSFCCFSSPFPCLPGKFETTKSALNHNDKDALHVTESWDPITENHGTTKNLDSSVASHHEKDVEKFKNSRFEAMDGTKKSGLGVSWSLPLNDSGGSQVISDSPSNIRTMRDENKMTLRSDPRMRLVTSASTMSDFDGDLDGVSQHSESSDWSLTGEIADPSEAQIFDVGLMITIDEGQCEFHLVPDLNYREIHPNAYGPANVTDRKILYGGGSGVSVFGGHHPQLGDIVMKHGGYKDTEDLFALATISEELNRRGELLGQISAAREMQERLPSYKMIYLSPHHIMDRGKELLNILKSFVRNWSMTSIPSNSSIAPTPKMQRLFDFVQGQQPQVNIGMTIRIFEGEGEEKPSFVLNTHSNPPKMSLVLPAGSTEYINARRIRVHGDAYDALKSVVEGLTTIMTVRLFKFTLAQKTIGGPNPKTGNQWLYEGKLSGLVLKNLMDQMIQIIQNLQKLTMPEEVDVVDSIREEVERFECDESGLRASDISPMADAFVGNAIKKNFHPEKGRQRFLREICAQFREGSLRLMPEEELPAKHLGNLLQSGALMGDTFVNSHMEPTVSQLHPHYWRNILRRAVESRSGMSKTALQRIWTCGLTDAGIHNLFVDETELYMFDLGEPQLMSLPGFLTKFLFSFFHTLGMEDDGDGSWVRRFVEVGDKLSLSPETQELLPKAYDAFEECLNRIIDELFDSDQHMRWLLLQYITMQLMSDTAFCLQKWEVKGGGRTAREGNHQRNQEKWLWRALWDIYVAFDINTTDSWYRFDVLHPHFQDEDE